MDSTLLQDIFPIHRYSSTYLSTKTNIWFNSCYRSCAHGQGLLCLELRADKAEGSTQWKMTLKPRLCAKTADNCDKSYFIKFDM